MIRIKLIESTDARNARLAAKARTREALGTNGLAEAALAREDARHATLKARRLAR